MVSISKNRKSVRIIAFLIGLLLPFTIASPVVADRIPQGALDSPTVPTYCGGFTFTDVFVTDFFCDAVRQLSSEGVITGYNNPDCTNNGVGQPCFLPKNAVGRGEFAKILVLAKGWTLLDPVTPSFSDVPRGSTFYKHVETAYNHGVMGGYSNPMCSSYGVLSPCFLPTNNITRGQMAKMISNAMGFNDNVTGRTPSFYDVPTSHAFFMWIERLVMHATVSPFPQGAPHSPCNTTTQPCFYPNDNAPRADAAQNIRSARNSNYYAQVFGWKWGLGNYISVEAYLTTPDPTTQNGQWHAGPVGAGDKYNIDFIESGPQKKCDPFCNIHPYGSWATTGGAYYDYRWDDTLNLGPGIIYQYKSIAFGGTGGQWQSQYCDGNGCQGMITSGNVGTTVPTVIVGGESSNIGLSFGSITVSNAKAQRLGGTLDFWCYDPTLPPLRTRSGTISSCTNYSWTVTH